LISALCIGSYNAWVSESNILCLGFKMSLQQWKYGFIFVLMLKENLYFLQSHVSSDVKRKFVFSPKSCFFWFLKENLSVLQRLQYGSRTNLSPCKISIRDPFPRGVKRSGRETHLHLELRFRMSRTIMWPFQYAFTSHGGTTLALLWDVVTSICSVTPEGASQLLVDYLIISEVTRGVQELQVIRFVRYPASSLREFF
jgi:hypothetical protein